MGEDDTSTDYLDRSCEANLQGINRFDRALNYFQYVRKYLKGHRHHFYSVFGVGHESEKIFKSQEAKIIFFQKSLTNDHFIINRIGQKNDAKITETNESLVFFGGGKNEKNGFLHLLRNAKEGDFLILSTKKVINHRYTHYLWNLAKKNNIKVNSISTISTFTESRGKDSHILSTVKNAEAIFFTGGDQYRYKNFWENSDLLKEIRKKMEQGIPVGGSSAGLAILGEYYFSAENGTIYSNEALKNPESFKITIEKNLLSSNLSKNLITDTHFSERNREGRLISFMSKISKKNDVVYGIGVDENTSLVLEKNRMRTYGAGDVFVYKHSRIIKSGLNFGPISRWKLEKGEIYPHYDRLMNSPNYLQVSDGIIFN